MEKRLPRGRHAGKYPEEQKAYLIRLAGFGVEPTKEELGISSSSDQPDDEKNTSRPKRTRKPRSPLEAASRHVARNKAIYITTAISLLFLLVIPFVVDIKSSISRLSAFIENIQRDVDRSATRIEKIEDKVNDQQLILHEHGIKIDNIDKQIENLQTKPNK